MSEEGREGGREGERLLNILTDIRWPAINIFTKEFADKTSVIAPTRTALYLERPFVEPQL